MAVLVDDVTCAIVLLILGLNYLLCIPVAIAHARTLWRAPDYWRHGGGATLLFPDRGVAIGEYLFFTGAFLAGVVGLGLMLYSQITETHIGATNRWTLFSAAIAISLATASWRKTPFTLRPSPALALTHDGIHVWPGTRYDTFISWSREPQVTEVIAYRLLLTATAHAIMTGCFSGYRFPMNSLPMEYSQLCRVVDFYVRNRRLRHELDTPEGLIRVQSLMQQSVREVEGQLPQRAKRAPKRQRRR